MATINQVNVFGNTISVGEKFCFADFERMFSPSDDILAEVGMECFDTWIGCLLFGEGEAGEPHIFDYAVKAEDGEEYLVYFTFTIDTYPSYEGTIEIEKIEKI